MLMLDSILRLQSCFYAYADASLGNCMSTTGHTQKILKVLTRFDIDRCLNARCQRKCTSDQNQKQKQETKNIERSVNIYRDLGNTHDIHR